MFGSLPPNPDGAQRQVHELDLGTVYRAVVRAWVLGVKKVLAVVFNDRGVVYGAVDIAWATELRTKSLESQ
ncbi:DUF1525 domain-containing protein [Serratia marcescens]|uniref:DUF1525 domain-containing protein n=1 Tax=Serratia marcescens TaxID=615 RepID=UPI003F848E6C